MKGTVAATNVEDAAALLKIGRAALRLQQMADDMERGGVSTLERITIAEAAGTHGGEIVLNDVPLWLLRGIADCIEAQTLGGLRGLGFEVEVKA